MIIEGRSRDVEGLPVARVLPAIGRRAVGPWVFFDHMGPADLAVGQGIDVRPHPHINLATVTYLFEGEMQHRDTLGSDQVIRPGEINWMTAGSGIAHSERTPAALRRMGSRVHGIQLWLALPVAHEETAPAFHHHDAGALPAVAAGGGARLRVLVGAAYGAASPVATFSPTFYVEASLPAGATLPLPGGYRERAAYVVEGTVRAGADVIEARRMLVLDGAGDSGGGGSDSDSDGAPPVLHAETPSLVMLLGGDPLDGPRHIWWNFVSSSKQRIETAKRDWREGRFGKIPGDDIEWIPLPER